MNTEGNLDQQAKEKANKILDKLQNKNILDSYDFLKSKFDKGFKCKFEEGSKEDIAFRAIIIALAETEAKIKFK